MEQLVKIRTIFVAFILLVAGCQKTQKEYYSNGNIKSVIKLNKKNNYDGQAKFYYENGKLEKLVNYDNGDIKECKVYYQNGQIIWRSPYLNNRKQGNYLEYYPNGVIKKSILFKQDTIMKFRQYDSLGNLTFEYLKLDTNNIPRFDSSYIKLLDKKINSNSFSRIQLNVPNIPASQLVPEVVNGKAKVINGIEGVWGIKALNDKKPIYIGIKIILENNNYYTFGYNIYSSNNN